MVIKRLLIMIAYCFNQRFQNVFERDWNLNWWTSCDPSLKQRMLTWQKCCAELGTRALLSGTWARPRKRDPPPLKVSVSSISFVTNPLFDLTLICFWCHMATNRTASAALRTPRLGRAHCHRGPNFRHLTTNFGWHAEEFCHWSSRFRHANRKRLPAPCLG